MDRLIKLDPSNTVPIRIEPNQKCHGEITLRNLMYTMPVAFRLQPLIKTRYTVKPHSGIISPLSTLTIEINYILPPDTNLPPSFPHSDDCFLLHSVVVPGATTKQPSETISNDWFTTKKKQVFIDTGIKIIFVGSSVLTELVTQNGSVDEIRHVLEFSDPTWKAVDSADAQGNTLLYLAITQRRPDLVQLLLEFEPDIEAPSRSGSTPLETACSSGEALIVELLLARKAKTERVESEWGPIHHAAREGHVEVLNLLLLKGAEVNSLTKDGNSNTALHLAVEERRRDCVKLLLANGARTDIRNGRDGDTVLHVAAVMGDEGLVKMLLQKGANKEVRNTAEKIAYDLAVENGQKRVFDALWLGDRLCVAARKGEAKVIQKLLEVGAVINGRDQNGWTALHRACFKGRIEVVRVLLEKGIDVDARDRDGYTALHCAVEAGHGDVAEVLVKKGVDVEARTKKGVSVLQIAEELQYVGIVRILVNCGAGRDHVGEVQEGEVERMRVKKKGKKIGRTAEVTDCNFDRSVALAS